MNLKFISYDGEYPCLCSGTLTSEFNDRQYKIHNCLQSVGEVYFSTDFSGVPYLSDELGVEYDREGNELGQMVNLS